MSNAEDFRLIETMRVSEDGEVFLLQRHLDRLRNSARHFSFKYDSKALRAAIRCDGPGRLRLTLSRDGTLETELSALPTRHPRHLRLSLLRVNSKDDFLYHKTTNRELYEDARRHCDDDTDVLLANERGELTQTTIANIAVRREGRWITPSISCGLLPGVMRAELLAHGQIRAGIIHVSELVCGETIQCFNAVRGIFNCDVEC
jgi:para-aminobenzoate synthetase / 4-amino-4-deoxychorismate lyase